MAPHKLILLYDGTWCGRETNTKTNIHLLAEMVGINMELEPTILSTENVKARYTHGVGLGSTLLDYLVDGAIARNIANECKEAYQYIVENYTPEHEIWMFGLSRGATTIRFVAGMINNCGIIKPTRDADGNIDHAMNKVRCDIVYDLYRSDKVEDRPEAQKMNTYRIRNSFPITTPIKFMGLFDTVGSLGIPQVSGSEGIVWPGHFYDNKISSVVEKVYHAVSTHDRLTAFKPTLAYRDRKHGPRIDLRIDEKWFPGTHYDLGRQEFRFFPSRKAYARILNIFSGTVKPNSVLSDLALKWMLEGVRQEDIDGSVVQDISQHIVDVNARLQPVGSSDGYERLLRYIPFVGGAVQQRQQYHHGSGDVYGKTLEYLAFGKFIQPILGRVSNASLLLRDRDILRNADVYHYKDPDTSLGNGIIRDLAQLDYDRYPSISYEKFMAFRQDLGLG